MRGLLVMFIIFRHQAAGFCEGQNVTEWWCKELVIGAASLAVLDFIICVILAVCLCKISRHRRSSRCARKERDRKSAACQPLTAEQHIQSYVARCTHESDPTSLLRSMPSQPLLPAPIIHFPPSADLPPCACGVAPASNDRTGYISMRNGFQYSQEADVTMVSATLNRVLPGVAARALARSRRMSVSVPNMASPPPSPLGPAFAHRTSRSRPMLPASVSPDRRRPWHEEYRHSSCLEESDAEDISDLAQHLDASENFSHFVRDTSVRIHEGEFFFNAAGSDVGKSRHNIRSSVLSEEYIPMTISSTHSPYPRQQQHHKHQRQPSNHHLQQPQPLQQQQPQQQPQQPQKQQAVRVALIPPPAPPACKPTQSSNPYENVLPSNFKSRPLQEPDPPGRQQSHAGRTSAEAPGVLPRASGGSKTGKVCRTNMIGV